MLFIFKKTLYYNVWLVTRDHDRADAGRKRLSANKSYLRQTSPSVASHISRITIRLFMTLCADGDKYSDNMMATIIS